jgi:hypothetical protein
MRMYRRFWGVSHRHYYNINFCGIKCIINLIAPYIIGQAPVYEVDYCITYCFSRGSV